MKNIILSITGIVIATMLLCSAFYSRQYIFAEKLFEQESSIEFDMSSDYKHVQMVLVVRDITKQIVERQGGKIISSKVVGMDINHPLKNLRVIQNKEIYVQPNNAHCKDILQLQQNIFVDKTQILVKTYLVQKTRLLRDYHNEMHITATSEGVHCKLKLKIRIAEHAPIQYDTKIKRELDQAIQANLEACRSCLEINLN